MKRNKYAPYYNKKKRELNDKAIIKAFDEAKELYDSGELLETEELLLNIINSIDMFTEEYEL